MTHGLSPEAIVYDLASTSDPRISPDGKRLLYTKSRARRDQSKPETQVWLSDIDGGNASPVTRSGVRSGGGRWSPDGKTISFVSDRGGDCSTLFLLPATTPGEARRLIRHKSAMIDPTWSPNGKQIAYVTQVDPGNLDEHASSGDNTPKVRVTDRLDYKQDQRGYLNDNRLQLFVVDAASGAKRRLTLSPDDLAVPAWSPDGRTIAVKVSTQNGMCSHIGLVDVETGGMRTIGGESGIAGVFAWSPDGRRMLVGGDVEQTWQLDWFMADVATGEMTRLTNDLPCLPDSGFPGVTPPSQPLWLDGRTALFHAVHRGRSGLWLLDTETGAVSEKMSWNGLSGGFEATADGRFIAQVDSNLESVGEIALVDREAGTRKQVTQVNREVLANHPLAKFETFSIERAGMTVEAWLLFPPDFDLSRTYPVVLDIHGGPNGHYGYGFAPIMQAMAAAGFLVVYSNPRGSSSYGRVFTQAVRQDWAGEDHLDLMAVLDSVLERPYADASRTGVYGYSYGGYMTSWIVGHTDRFKAAVIGAPVVDMRSFYGTSDIGHIFGKLQMGAAPHEDVAEYETRSPITHLHHATTPSLILHGEADDRCPVGQGEQCFVALKQAGCEVQFVRYPGGSHALPRTGYPAHRVDFYSRINDWFRSHLKA